MRKSKRLSKQSKAAARKRKTIVGKPRKSPGTALVQHLLKESLEGKARAKRVERSGAEKKRTKKKLTGAKLTATKKMSPLSSGKAKVASEKRAQTKKYNKIIKSGVSALPRKKKKRGN